MDELLRITSLNTDNIMYIISIISTISLIVSEYLGTSKSKANSIIQFVQFACEEILLKYKYNKIRGQATKSRTPKNRSQMK